MNRIASPAFLQDNRSSVTAAVLAALVLLALVCTFWIGVYGYSFSDVGFVTELAWRIDNGEILYRDFVYVRPPLTPWLQAGLLWLSGADHYLVAGHFYYYLQVLLGSYWAALVFVRHSPRASALNLPLLITLVITGFAWNAHDFPPMPWHSVDGVFFGALGLFLISEKRWYEIGGVALMMAALAKQSYYPLPLVGIVLAAGSGGLWAAVRVLVAVTVTVLAVLLTLWMQGALASFIAQTCGAVSPGDTVEVFKAYLVPKYLYAIFACLAVAVGIKRYALKQFPAAGIYALLAFAGVCAGSFYKLFTGIKIWGGYANVLYLACAITWALDFAETGGFGSSLKDRLLRQLAPLSFFALGGLSSMSWGYKTSALMCAPAVFYLLHHAARCLPRGVFTQRAGLAAALLISVAYFYLANTYPFMTSRRPDLTVDLGAVTPRLSHIKGDVRTRDKLADFLRLASKYPDFVMVPSFPGAYFLASARNPTPVDWYVDVEAGEKEEAIYPVVRDGKAVIFAELSPDFTPLTSGNFGSTVLRWAGVNGCEIEVSPYFHVLSAAKIAGGHC